MSRAPIREAVLATLRAVDGLGLAAVISDDGATVTVHHCPRHRARALAKVPTSALGYPVVLAPTSTAERRRISDANGRRNARRPGWVHA